MMEKECPRCKLPQEGINQCEYCGLVFKNYKKDSIASLLRISIYFGFGLAVLFLSFAVLK
jgi:hypothetical protein